MAIAATISVPLTSPTRRTLASLSNLSRRSTLPTLQRTFKYPNLRLVASSMSTKTAVKTSSASFLHRKESGFLHFAKYHGLGNDFILIDNRDSSEPRISAGKAVQLCDRNFGVGADGVIFVLPGINGTDYTMRIFNSDGSEPEMCGNGVRCFAKFVSQLKNLHGRHSFTIHTGAGLIIPEVLEDGNVRVDMGEPILKASDVPTNLPANKDNAVVKSELVVDGVIWHVTCVSMGNPHCVTFSREGRQNLLVDELKLAEIGPKFEHHEVFPARTNTGAFHTTSSGCGMDNDPSIMQPRLERRFSVCDRVIFGHRKSDLDPSFRWGYRPSDYSRASDYSRPSDYSRWGSSDDDNGLGDSPSTVSPLSYGGPPSAEDGYGMPGRSRYCLVASKQMVGIFLTIWVRSELKDHVRNMKVSCVGRGLMGYLGNKPLNLRTKRG